MEKERISKILARRGLCSRREAEALIEEGLVLVNGEIVTEKGSKASKEDLVTVKPFPRKKVTLLLHKPVDIVSNLPEEGYKEASSLLIPKNQWKKDPIPCKNPIPPLHVVGRLDINSKGLLLFTEDGRVAKKIIGPTSNVEKEYLVKYEGVLTEKGLSLLRKGITLEGKKLKRAFVEKVSPNKLRFILQEGKKRQIRKMCKRVSLSVISLKRIRIGPFLLGDLPIGKWRFATEKELEKLGL